jgi:hypothetical protein
MTFQINVYGTFQEDLFQLIAILGFSHSPLKESHINSAEA